jgi:hypothetical protein
MKAKRRGISRAQSAINKSLPPPVGGLNARDALSDMDEMDAIVMDNIFPESNYCAVRKGHADHRDGMTNPIRTLMTYRSDTGSDTLFAATDDTIYEVTSPGSAGTVSATGFNSGDWQWINFETPGGQYIVICNGADTPQLYNGSAWAAMSASGVTTSSLIHVTQHKERLWFVENQSRNLWYFPVATIGGLLIKFPMGSVFKRGGFIVACASFSHDAGLGPDDFFTVMSSEGEVAVYAGTDPGSAATWALVGLYDTGKPVGRRCYEEVNGDLVWITTDGAISMQKMVKYDRTQMDRSAVTAKINNLFNEYIASYATLFGWQAMTYPERRYLIINVPTQEDESAVQLVMNTITGAWCRFTGLGAVCWGSANGNLYFGDGSGNVWQADTTFADNGGTIFATTQTAYNYLGQRGSNKLWTAIRPILISNGAPSYGIALNVDFGMGAEPGEISAVAGNAGVWDSGLWDSAQWAGSSRLTKAWQTFGAIGFCGSVVFEVQCQGQSCQINSFDVLARPGGPY